MLMVDRDGDYKKMGDDVMGAGITTVAGVESRRIKHCANRVPPDKDSVVGRGRVKRKSRKSRSNAIRIKQHQHHSTIEVTPHAHYITPLPQ